MISLKKLLKPKIKKQLTDFEEVIKKMQIKKILIALILSSFFVSSFAYAEVGTVQMKSDDPTNVETEEAKNNAIKSAWKSFVSKFNPSKMKQYNLVKEDIEQNIDDTLFQVKLLKILLIKELRLKNSY